MAQAFNDLVFHWILVKNTGFCILLLGYEFRFHHLGAVWHETIILPSWTSGSSSVTQGWPTWIEHSLYAKHCSLSELILTVTIWITFPSLPNRKWGLQQFPFIVHSTQLGKWETQDLSLRPLTSESEHRIISASQFLWSGYENTSRM